MPHWPDRPFWDQPPDTDREAPPAGAADRDATAPRTGSGEEDWENLWVDLGGEG